MRTVGGLAAVAGASLAAAVVTRHKRPETVALAVGTGLVFAIADLYAARTQSRIYLGDTILQAAFVPAWTRPWARLAFGAVPSPHRDPRPGIERGSRGV